ncbi:MAG TPA: metallophosphoesterase [Anaerolineae bacterium]|nr:metallophosphoesterase [Anaerolineae bacterium]HQI86565.1 metallophosphoesterase [Anaerolineae bacterium]
MWNRVVSLDDGVVMVVTDLHGDWSLYERYRDIFLALRERGLVDTLVLAGDFIHSEGPPEMDKSLDIVLDLMALRETLGPRLIVLLGNHEMAHLYAVVLSKGDFTYTPRFEAVLGGRRDAVLTFFDGLPFFVRTRAGVTVCHTGAFPQARDRDAMARLCAFSHRDVWARGAARAPLRYREPLRLRLGELSDAPYEDLVRDYFAITDPHDPHYDDYLISQYAMAEPAFDLLWAAFCESNELQYGETAYAGHVVALLRGLSEGYALQSVLVTGHIGCRNGYRVVGGGRQLRLASGIHAYPYESARYLLFDAGKPVENARALLPGIGSVFRDTPGN